MNRDKKIVNLHMLILLELIAAEQSVCYFVLSILDAFTLKKKKQHGFKPLLLWSHSAHLERESSLIDHHFFKLCSGT